MRFVIDMQAAQLSNQQDITKHFILLLGQAIIRNLGEHEVILALNGLLSDTIEKIRAAVQGILPEEKILVWEAPGPVNCEDFANIGRRLRAELIYEAFVYSLKPDCVLIAIPFIGAFDNVVSSIKHFKYNVSTAVILSDTISLMTEVNHADNPLLREWFESKLTHLRKADFLFWLSDKVKQEIVQKLGLSPEKCYSFLANREQIDWDQTAKTVISLFESKHQLPDEYEKISNETLLSELIQSLTEIEPHPNDEIEWVNLAHAIHLSIGTKRSKKQFLLDISNLVQNDNKTGIHRVTRNILHELVKNPPKGYLVEPVYASEDNGYRYARRFMSQFFNRSYLALTDDYIDFASGDVFLCIDLNHTLVSVYKDFYQKLKDYGVLIYFIVYDLLPILIPNTFQDEVSAYHEQWLKIITQMEGALCISQSVANELFHWLQEQSEFRLREFKISWFHLGAEISSFSSSKGVPNDAPTVLKCLSSKITFLMVATIEPRKSHAQVLEAFEQLWKEDFDINLVFVGQKGWKVDYLVEYMQLHPQLNNRFFWLEAVTDEYLVQIYEASSCLIVASLGEGFGLPLIEAARYGLPIIARDIPVFREVAAEHAFYFSGLKPEDLRCTIKKWLALRQTQTHPGSKKISWLTWSESARQLIQRLFEL